jgi:signal transduction histidine kinase
MMFSSLRTRLWLSYALLIAAALSVVAFVLVAFLVRNPLIYRQTTAKLSAVEALMLSEQADWADLPAPQLQQTLVKRDHILDTRFIVIDSNRAIIADSRPDQKSAFGKNPRLPRLARTGILRDVQGNAWVIATAPLQNGNTLALALPRPRAPLLAIFGDELLRPILQAGVVALALALILAFLMARWIADPLQRVVTAARAFPERELKPLASEGPQEVQSLVSAFNQMIARVQSAQKAQRDFVANVSHELKTPLTSIQGFAQAILDGTADTPAAQKQSAQIIYTEAGRMHSLALDLLDLARLDAGIADLKRAPLDPASILRGVIEKLSLQARQSGVDLILDAAPDLEITGDGDRLAQVFTNLIDNALKFTPAGGNVSVQLTAVEAWAQITVSDTGTGISPEALPHVFERFYRADPARQGGEQRGTGLGLSIANEIVHAHGGRITARSTPESGSVFTVRLPLASAEISTAVSKRKK